MVNKTNFAVMGGSVVGGMIASEIIAQEIAKLVPMEIPHLADMLQMGGGLALILALGKYRNMIGKVAVYGGIGSIASGVLGMLNIKIPYIAQAGEPQPIELIPIEETNDPNIKIERKPSYKF